LAPVLLPCLGIVRLLFLLWLPLTLLLLLLLRAQCVPLQLLLTLPMNRFSSHRRLDLISLLLPWKHCCCFCFLHNWLLSRRPAALARINC
jgi:hypothetical protein